MSSLKNISFKPREELIAVIRRVPLVDALHYAIAALLLLLPFFFFFPLIRWKPWGLIVGAVVGAAGLYIFIRTFFLWYHNVFVITSERIIDFDQRGFFEHVVSQSSFEKIQDVSVHMHGALQTTFRFGDINLKTGWGSVDLCVPNVYRPHRVQRVLLEAQDAYIERNSSMLGVRVRGDDSYEA